MATSGHGHGEPFMPTGPTHGMPYEPDTFPVKAILAVPIVVVITAAICYVTTALLFGYIFDPKLNNDPGDVAIAAKDKNLTLNERVVQTSSTDPTADVEQPRLEGVK